MQEAIGGRVYSDVRSCSYWRYGNSFSFCALKPSLCHLKHAVEISWCGGVWKIMIGLGVWVV